MENAELLNALFASVFTSKTSLQESQVREISGGIWRKEDLPLVDKDQVREYLSKLDICKSMGLDGMHQEVLRELVDVIVRPLSIIFDRTWWLGKVPEDWKTANGTPIFKKDKKEDPGTYMPFSLISIPGKMVEQLILETVSRHMMNKVIKSSLHGFTKEVMFGQHDNLL